MQAPPEQLTRAEHFLQANQPAQAHALLAALLPSDPNNPKLRHLLARSLIALRRPAEAIPHLDHIQALIPGEVNSLISKAAALDTLMRPADAEAIVRAVLARVPNHVGALSILANALQHQGKMRQARELCIQQISSGAGHPSFVKTWAECSAHLGDPEEWVEACARFAQLVPNLGPVLASLAVGRSNLSDDRDEVLRAHHAFGAAIGATPCAPPASDWPRLRSRPERRRVGLLSLDFHEASPIWAFLRSWVEHATSARFEIFAYHLGAPNLRPPDRLTARATLRWLPGAAPAQAHAAMRADSLDILIDMGSLTCTTGLAALVPRVCPVQVTWMGYANTTGLPTMDWRLVDSITDPPPAADAFASERLERVDPCFLCYTPPDGTFPIQAREPGAPPVFASFAHTTKLNRRVLTLWGRVLAAVPGSRLLLKNVSCALPDAVEHIRVRLAQCGVDPARVDFIPMPRPYADHLACFNRADTMLDTFPYNATTSLCEALFMGVPMVCRVPAQAHDRHAARVTMSLLRAAGLEEFLARDDDDYVAIAAALARDTAKRARLRQELRPRLLASPLCDAPAFAKRFEAALERLWQDAVARGAPTR